LEKFSTTGVRDIRLVNRAKIILALDISGGRTPERRQAIADRLGISRQTVNVTRRDFLAVRNLTIFLQRKQRETPPVPSKITGELEARVIALACSEPPKGYSRWTLRLLAQKTVELFYCDSMSHMTISTMLKKTNLSLISKPAGLSRRNKTARL
jgi:hypothetical protein